jgi:hypothetical protein
MADREISMASSIKRGDRVALPDFALLHKTQMIGRKQLLEKIKEHGEIYLQDLRNANPNIDSDNKPIPQKIIEAVQLEPERELPDLVYSALDIYKNKAKNALPNIHHNNEYEIPEMNKLIPKGVQNAKNVYDHLTKVKDLGFETMGIALSIAGVYYGFKNGWDQKYLEIPGAIGVIMATSAMTKYKQSTMINSIEAIQIKSTQDISKLHGKLVDENSVQSHTLVQTWLRENEIAENSSQTSTDEYQSSETPVEVSGQSKGAINLEPIPHEQTVPDTQSPRSLCEERRLGDSLWSSKQLPLLNELHREKGSTSGSCFASKYVNDCRERLGSGSAIEENYLEDSRKNQATESNYWIEECHMLDKKRIEGIDANELEFPVYHERPHIIVTCPGGIKVKALIDLGATSSSIGPHTVSIIEENLRLQSSQAKTKIYYLHLWRRYYIQCIRSCNEYTDWG